MKRTETIHVYTIESTKDYLVYQGWKRIDFYDFDLEMKFRLEDNRLLAYSVDKVLPIVAFKDTGSILCVMQAK